MKQGWEIKKLGEVCSIIMGQSPSSDTYNDSEGLPFFQGNADFGKIHPSIRVYCNAPIRIADVDDILISVRAPIGAINIADCKCCIGRGLASIRNNAEVANEYIYHALIANKERLIAQGTGSTFKSIGKEALKELSIPVPPREEQERIVAELDCLSGVIEKKREQLRELDALAQSIFYQMFGDPITNEKGWGIDRLGNMCDISSSKRIYAHEYCEDGIPFYRGKEITEKSKGNDISVELYIAEDRYNELKHKYGVPQIGDILITAVGTIGNIWVVDNDTPFYFKDGNVLWLQIKDNINPIYFKTLLYNLIDKYKESMANGCAYSALTIVNLKEMQTNKIPFALQQEFANRIENIEQQKKLISQSIKEVEDLFNSRMDYYFN